MFLCTTINDDRSYSLNPPLAWSASRLPSTLLGIDELSAVYHRSKHRSVVVDATLTTTTTTPPSTSLNDRSRSTRPLSSSSSSLSKSASRIIRYYSKDRSVESDGTIDDSTRSDEKTQHSESLDGMTVCLTALDDDYRELQAL
jgi:hypothetical protein